MGGAFGLLVNPSEPSKYDVVMEIVAPLLLQQRVPTQTNPSCISATGLIEKTGT